MLFLCKRYIYKHIIFYSIPHIFPGAPFYTVVTVLPHYESCSTFASFFRIFFYITWLFMMLPMMSADCMPITHLIIMANKNVTLCRYFKKIRSEFDEDVFKMSKKESVNKLKAGCLEGIKIHQKLILYAKSLLFL